MKQKEEGKNQLQKKDCCKEHVKYKDFTLQEIEDILNEIQEKNESRCFMHITPKVEKQILKIMQKEFIYFNEEWNGFEKETQKNKRSHKS